MDMFDLRKYCVLFLCVLYGTGIFAQTTKVRGRVVDAVRMEPLPLVNVEVDGCSECTSTDLQGFYMIELDQAIMVDSLQFSLNDYNICRVKVVNGCFNEVDIVLEPCDKKQGVFGWPCVDSLVRNARRHEYFNTEYADGGYSCKLYTKINLGLQDFTPSKIKNQNIIDKYGFVFENVDTSVMTGKSYIWAMVSESKAKQYYDHKLEPCHELIEASNISGVNNNPQLAKFTGQLNSDIDVYDDFISILKVDFLSPLAEIAPDYYTYYFIDSLEVDYRKTYRVRFEPKKMVIPVFSGELWVDSASYAVCEAHLVMAKGVDMNWVNALSLDTKRRISDDGVWLKCSERQKLWFAVLPNDSSKLYSVLLHRGVDYSDFDTYEELDQDIAKARSGVVVSDSALLRNNDYWDVNRAYALTPEEQDVFYVGDSVREIIQARPNRNTLMSLIFGGYLKTRYFKFGPYYELFSFNDVEDARFQIGVNTTPEVCADSKFSGYLAYGTGDERFKGGFKSVFMLRRNTLRRLTIDIKHDLVQLGQADDALAESNIFTSIFARDQKRMNMVNSYSLSGDLQWCEGINTNLTLSIENVSTSSEVPFVRADSSVVGSIQVSGLSVATRFSWDEISYVGRYEQKYLYSKKPYFTFKASGGVKHVFMNDYNFLRTELVGQYSLSLAPLGVSHFTLTGGKIFGKVPFLLLKLHEGNGTYFYSQTAFSCMNYYEFASDAWVSLMYEHDFRGVLLKYVPLIKKTNWRTVFTLKSVYGSISDRNNGSLPDTEAVLVFPKGMSELKTPYVEAGVGIKNIFRVLRVDAIWRLTHRDTDEWPHNQNFVFNFGAAFTF